MVISNKLKEMHTDLWGLYDLSLQSKNTYVAILIYKYIQKPGTYTYKEKIILLTFSKYGSLELKLSLIVL